jgi:hypothetical protein
MGRWSDLYTNIPRAATNEDISVSCRASDTVSSVSSWLMSEAHYLNVLKAETVGTVLYPLY